MMLSKIFSSLISGALTFCTALGVLWTTSGVENFSDVSQVSYAVAALGGVVTALKDVQSRNADPGIRRFSNR